ncbi:TPR-like protein [Serendipita vermifera]|nr:TPR-like protein [Serendipita vermifera]
MVERQKRHEFLGPKHPDTLLGMATLLIIYYYLSQHDTAISLATEVAQTCRVVSRGRLSTASRSKLGFAEFTAVNVRAKCLWALGRHEEAVKHGYDAVYLSKVTFRGKHPNMFEARSNLMLYLTFEEEHIDASEQETQLKGDCIRTLGKQHPASVEFKAKLALRHSQMGKVENALQIGEEVVKWRESILGLEHPETYLARSYMALYLANAGRYKEALQLEEQVLKAFQKRLGEDHPYSMAAMHNLAGYCCHLEMYSEALRYGKEALALRERVIGRNHPYTTLTRRQVKDYQSKVCTL